MITMLTKFELKTYISSQLYQEHEKQIKFKIIFYYIKKYNACSLWIIYKQNHIQNSTIIPQLEKKIEKEKGNKKMVDR